MALSDVADWLNSKKVLPWVAGLVTIIFAAGYWQATVTAQEHAIAENKIAVGKDADQLRADVLERLNLISRQLDKQETRMEALDNKVTEVQLDLSAICRGKCRK